MSDERARHETPAVGWERVEEIFAAAVGVEASARSALLDRACGDDDKLRREVESLIAADDNAGGFLAGPAVSETDVEALVADRAAPQAGLEGCTIGPYRLLRKIGEGGMASVYLAVRADDEYRQQVALKIFGWDRERRDLVRRFRTERQILASLQHPSIARLLDGGTTDDGLPYLVMEYIEGEPIDTYCDRRRYSLGERLKLFEKLCAAVQYAHRALVVHRDIKPSNVLVTAGGELKLLDFGIAKLIAPEQFPATVERTVTGQRLMTPSYASPEQVRGDSITTASDVYSLGVLLYRLLTGGLPFRVGSTRVGEVEQAVLEQEPERPSVAVSRSGDRATTDDAGPRSVSRARGTRPERLRRALAGDLDNIVLKALRKEPERRYGSAENLGEDLQRHRRGLPVRARPDTLGYRAGKFLRRNRWGVAAAAAFLALAVGFGVVTSMERDEARRERDKAEAVAAFLEEIFAVSDPSTARGTTVTARDLLDRGAERLERDIAGQPEVEAALAGTIGSVYRSLGLFEPAEPLLRRSLALREEVYGTTHAEVTSGLLDLAFLLEEKGELPAAEELLRRALEAQRAASSRSATDRGAKDRGELARVLDRLGVVLGKQGDYAESEELLREAVALRRRDDGDDQPEVAESLNNLARVFDETGRLEAAEAQYREALRIARDAFGDVHPDVATFLNNLGLVLSRRGDYAAADAYLIECVEVSRKLFADPHPTLARYLDNLAVHYAVRGQYDKVEPLFREALEMRRVLLGENHSEIAIGLNNLGRLHHVTGDLEAAEDLYRQALEVHRRALGDDHPSLGVQLHNLGEIRHEVGDLAGAEELYRDAVDLRRRALGEEHPDFGRSLAALGSLRAESGAPGGGVELARQGVDVLRRALPAGHPHIATAESHLAACLTALGRFEQAEPPALSAYEALLEAHGPDHRRTVLALRRLAALYDVWQRPDAAERYRTLLEPQLP